MPRRIVLSLSLALLLTAPPAAGQIREPEVQNYSFVSGVGLGSGIWVNPGAAGFNRTTNLVGHVTFDRPEDDSWSTGQYMAGFQTPMFGFGYRHDEFGDLDGYAQGDAYTVALGTASGRNGMGVSRTFRTVGRTEGSWEIGWVSHAPSGVSAGLVWRDIGSPVVRDTIRFSRLIGGLTYRARRTPATLSAQADYRMDGGQFRAFRIGGSLTLLDVLDLHALAQWTGDGDFDGFRLGLMLRKRSMIVTGGAGLNSTGDVRTASAGLGLIGQRR